VSSLVAVVTVGLSSHDGVRCSRVSHASRMQTQTARERGLFFHVRRAEGYAD
jgi:hypothetical protein